MTALATFAVAPDDEAGWQTWAFAHMASHIDIARVAFQLSGSRLDIFPLDPVTFDNQAWIYNHAAMHDQMNQLLGGGGYDLTGVEWNNEQSVRDFMLYNYIDHQRAEQTLGL